MIPLLSVLLAYVLGAIPFGYLLVRWKTGGDIRASGSGNTGATNVLRTTGIVVGVATLLLDIGKGYAAVWFADRASSGSAFWMSFAALAVMAGHAYPVFLGFKGGKAVASFIGAFLKLVPLATIAMLVVFLVVVAKTRYISLGSIIGAATFPLAVWLIFQPPLAIEVASLVAAVFIIYRHRSNIQRLQQGSERLIRFGARRS
jgi:acyl phosphate:glycerol-3-phosphate acyltransferase